VVTHPRVFARPTPIAHAIDFCDALRTNGTRIEPGRRHWRIFSRLSADVGARGNVVPDAYLAAIAIESNSEWITTDRGFRRFPGLRLRHPLDDD
jgi:toxin-antitoxin system PIN domain toxin